MRVSMATCKVGLALPAPWPAIITAIENILNEIVTDPNAQELLKGLEAWINMLLGVGKPNAMALGGLLGGGILIKLVTGLLAQLASNPQALQEILAVITSLLTK